jgi:hypothetical protein
LREKDLPHRFSGAVKILFSWQEIVSGVEPSGGFSNGNTG